MTARQKIEHLTHAWYGYVTFSAIASLFRDGIPGFFSIIWAGMGLLVSLFVTWFIGRRLLAKSSLVRFVLLVWTGIGSLFGAMATGKAAWVFFQTWSFSFIGIAVFAGVAAYMHMRSFRTLMDSSVRAYFN